MGVERQDITLQSADGSVQHQTATKRIAPIQSESPSTIKYLVQEDMVKGIARTLAGWVQVPNEAGQMEWRQIGKPLINERGRAWLISQLSSILSKSVTLSNYPESRLPQIFKTEFNSCAVHLSTHLRDFDLDVNDTENVMLYMRRAIESAYRSAVGDRGRKHVYGSIDENVNIAPKRDDKILGFIPKPF
jgi:hypothetical protein